MTQRCVVKMNELSGRGTNPLSACVTPLPLSRTDFYMFGQNSLNSVISFVKDLPARLNQPVPLPEVLLTEIPLPLPGFFKKHNRRHNQRSRAKAQSAARQSAANKEGELSAGQFQYSGALETGVSTIYSVNGRDFVFDSDTWVFGDIGIGAYARIKGTMRNGERYATHITVGRE